MLFSAIALFAGLAAAIHPIVGEPDGNAVRRPLNEIVPAGKPFEIKWDPTTPNTLSIQLLKGPSENAIPFQILVEELENTGSFIWTPSTSLEPTEDETGYGLILIDDETGQYQYSTQFGISNPDYEDNLPTGTVTPTPYSKSQNGTISTLYPTTTPLANSTTIITSTTLESKSTSLVDEPTTLPTTGTPTSPTSQTSPPPAENTNGASSLTAGLGLFGAVAAAMFMV